MKIVFINPKYRGLLQIPDCVWMVEILNFENVMIHFTQNNLFDRFRLTSFKMQ